MQGNTPGQPVCKANLITILVIGVITLLRLLAVLLTPLDLGTDEAQYWHWSLHPDWGYFSKPPMIAWIIHLGQLLLGDTAFAIRAPAVLLHGLTALLLWQAASRLYTPAAGRLVAVLWLSLPAVGLGSAVMSTDTPMLTALAAMLWLLAPLANGDPMVAARPAETAAAVSGQLGQNRQHWRFFLAGIAIGTAGLAKYAGLYALAGLLLWQLVCRLYQTRLKPAGPKPTGPAVMSPGSWCMLLAGTMLILGPNLLWNAGHQFATITHLQHNANLGDAVAGGVVGAVLFLFSQAAVLGPVALLVLPLAFWQRRRDPASWFCLAFSLPPLLAITLQAAFSEANANWAVAAWPSALLLLAGWLQAAAKGTRNWIGGLILASNGLLSLLLIAVLISGSLGPLTPVSDPLRRLRGWSEHAAQLRALYEIHQPAAVITERRSIIARLAWQLRDLPLQLEIHDPDGRADNHYEAEMPWRRQPGRSVILVTENPDSAPEIGLQDAVLIGQSVVRISSRRDRRLYFLLATE